MPIRRPSGRRVNGLLRQHPRHAPQRQTEGSNRHRHAETCIKTISRAHVLAGGRLGSDLTSRHRTRRFDATGSAIRRTMSIRRIHRRGAPRLRAEPTNILDNVQACPGVPCYSKRNTSRTPCPRAATSSAANGYAAYDELPDRFRTRRPSSWDTASTISEDSDWSVWHRLGSHRRRLLPN